MFKKTLFPQLIMVSFIAMITSCNTTRQGINNSTTDNGIVYTTCDVNGELAMLSAPILIDNDDQIQCSNITLSMRTPIVLKDDYYSLAQVCTNKLFPELYYSTNRRSLDQLESLSSTEAGANFQLPNGVGRLVESRSLNPNQLNDDRSFYIRPGVNYSPNRLVFNVKMPSFIADFSAQNINFNLNQFRTGDIIYYKWAKRINKVDGGDPIRFSETFQIRFQAPNGVNAGPDQVITLPQQRSVVLNGTLSDASNSIRSIAWKWILPPSNVRDGWDPPTIVSTNTPITEVIFNDFGFHDFELSAEDNCGVTFKDIVRVNVRGDLNGQTSSINCIIQSKESCADGLGRNVYLKNTSSVDGFKVRIKLKHDLRSWQDTNTPGAGTVREIEDEISLNPGQEVFLDCNVLNGIAPINGADRAYKTWTIISEQKL